jgi:IS30 family transposase
MPGSKNIVQKRHCIVCIVVDFGKYTRKDIRRIENRMNNYPRRIFGYKTANDIYNAA